jgi:hypothetical protein
MLEVVKLSHEVLTWLWDREKPIGVPPLDRLTVWGCSVDALDVEKLRDAGLAVMDCPVMLTETVTIIGKQGELGSQLRVTFPLWFVPPGNELASTTTGIGPGAAAVA